MQLGLFGADGRVGVAGDGVLGAGGAGALALFAAADALVGFAGADCAGGGGGQGVRVHFGGGHCYDDSMVSC